VFLANVCATSALLACGVTLASVLTRVPIFPLKVPLAL
jgi:hypothetical protein